MPSNHTKNVRDDLPKRTSRRIADRKVPNSRLKRVNSSEDYIEIQDPSKDETWKSHRRASVDKSSTPSNHKRASRRSSFSETSTQSLGKKKPLDANQAHSSKMAKKAKKTPKGDHPPRQRLPLLDDTYILKHVVKGHTEINIPVRDKDDIEDSKDIWCCEFEPCANDLGAFDRQKPGQIQHLALCGSYTVLFADTSQGKYIKKYTHVENQEIFYCMAWTRLEGRHLLDATVFDDQDDVRFCNILAVAGRLGSIKLLSPLQNECYRYLFGHQKAVLAMTFAKAEPRWLFTASADKTVRLWDVGSPTSTMDDSICLAKFDLPQKSGEPSAVSISYDLSTLIVGCNNGDLVEFKITAAQLKQYQTSAATYKSEGPEADKLDFLSNVDRWTIYPAGDEWHEGYVDDVYIIGQDGDNRHRLNNKIVSRGSEDMEIIVWDPVGSTRDDAKIDMAFDWPDAADCTGLRFKVIEKEGKKVLIAGDYDGQIHIYDIGNCQTSKTLPDGTKELFKPNRILSHSMSSEIIRDVTCSHDTKTIVAVDNNNNLFIWTSSTCH